MNENNNINNHELESILGPIKESNNSTFIKIQIKDNNTSVLSVSNIATDSINEDSEQDQIEPVYKTNDFLKTQIESIVPSENPTSDHVKSNHEINTQISTDNPSESSVSTVSESDILTSNDEKVVVASSNTAIIVTNATQTIEIKDNTKGAQNNTFIYDISALIVLVLTIVVAKFFSMKRRAQVAVNRKFTQKDKEFLRLINHLNQVYKKTDKYLNQSSKV
jgi:hypothetical protein